MATFRDKLPEKEAALVAKLKAETEEVLFYRVMKPTMVEDVKAFPYQLEFPLHFLEELQRYKMDLSDSVVLEMFDSAKEWRVAITRSKRAADYKERVRFQGASGWQEFVLENNVRVGDFVLFQLIGADRFRVWKQPLSDYTQTPSQWRPRQ